MKKYKVFIGTDVVIATPTGRSEVRKDMSFTRPIFKVLDYGTLNVSYYPNDEIYLMPSTKRVLI